VPALARRIAAYYDAHPRMLDLTLVAVVTACAAVLRLALLGRIPYGVHSDEAQLGTDGYKILDGDLWTVYTHAVLGQPSGHAYLTLPSFELLGWTPLAMRLPLALVALPMIIYVANPDSFYWFHINNYGDVRVTQEQEYKDASAWGKVEVIGDQVRDFAAAYAWDAPLDIVDGNGQRPMFDPPTVILLLAGLVIAFQRRREPMVVAAVCCFVIIPLPAVPQEGSIMRQPMAAAPYAMLLAALPLASLWRWGVGLGASSPRDADEGERRRTSDD
jgi:hypothetical protein